jgi:hypothetical protein
MGMDIEQEYSHRAVAAPHAGMHEGVSGNGCFMLQLFYMFTTVMLVLL